MAQCGKIDSDRCRWLGLFVFLGLSMAGSPAIDAANSESCPATDQRGVARAVGDGCDIGAYEGGTRTVEFTIFLPMTVK